MYAEFMLLITFVIMVGFIIQPLLLKKVDRPDDEDITLETLKLRKKVIYKQIKEAEMEYEMGNLSEEDYIRTRNSLKEEASSVIKTIEKK
ncbi:MAG: hypothetical protein IIB44_00155 [Candidatus Marinimicrobia bacterium]|nr:hypothetical protein [Candidatus Neomarinimicrobiota bacterium]MCH8067662.1 hypothetical protein [Candidatus Neomarinimicrobiota bacterium]